VAQVDFDETGQLMADVAVDVLGNESGELAVLSAWDWRQLVEAHSLGRVAARDDEGLVGFATSFETASSMPGTRTSWWRSGLSVEGLAQQSCERASTAPGPLVARRFRSTSATGVPLRTVMAARATTAVPIGSFMLTSL
jgi:hypothetical protein